MPTTRPRYTLTETDELRVLLDRARELWPDTADNPRELILRLMREGVARVNAMEPPEAERLSAIDELEAEKPSWYPEGYLEDVRRGWHERCHPGVAPAARPQETAR